MTDHVVVRGLRVATRVGVTEEERAHPQVVVVDLDVSADLAAPAATDDLSQTIDYASLVTAVSELVQSSEAKLLESLAESIAALVSRAKEANGVTVEITKEKVPVEEDVERVSVRLERVF